MSDYYARIRSYKVSGYQGLLDLYPNAEVAFSMRKLRAAYTGYCMRIRRGIDNALLDIPFTPMGEIDLAVINDFIGSGDGFVDKYYDQSGNNNDLYQVLPSAQPQIVFNGLIVTKGAYKKPIIYATVNQTWLLTSQVDVDLSNGGFSFFVNYYKVGNQSINALMLTNGSSYLYLDYNPQYVGQVPITTPQIAPNLLYLVSANNNPSTKGTIYFNNAFQGGSGVPSSTGSMRFFPCDTATFRYNTVMVNELIVYNIDQDMSINAINANINNYYGIY